MNPKQKMNRPLLSIFAIAAILLSSLSFLGSTRTLAQNPAPFIDVVQALEAKDTGINQPLGLAFSGRLNSFYVIDARQWRGAPASAEFLQVSSRSERSGSARFASALENPLNMAFDNRSNRLLVLQPRSGQLIQIAA